MIFSSPTCDTCVDLLPEVAQWQRAYAEHFTVVLVNRGDINAVRSKVASHDLTHVLLQQDNEVAMAYQSAGTPSALLVAVDGSIRSPLAAGIIWAKTTFVIPPTAAAVTMLNNSAVSLPVSPHPMPR